MQNRQVRSFVNFVASDRWTGNGKNPHFGFQSYKDFFFLGLRFINNDLERIICNEKLKLTLISTANQFPPTRSVARTPFLLSRLIASFSLRSAGRTES